MNQKSLSLLLVTILLAAATLRGQTNLSNRLDSISYALGMDVGRNIGKLDMGLQAEMIYQGIKDAFEGKEGAMSEEQVQALMQAFQNEARNAQMKAQQEAGQAAQARGEAFLAENAQRDSVSVTASGLQYQVIREGTGPKPSAESTVKVHYEGRLLDGKVFDSSYQRGEPIEFPLNGVIPGWTEGLQLMSAGAKYRLYIPAALAYGSRGAGQDIGPNEALIFDVELLEVK
jgi:FKBP-type peptidyl-prolyl cis-trans isomerase